MSTALMAVGVFSLLLNMDTLVLARSYGKRTHVAMAVALGAASLAAAAYWGWRALS
jgi:hypothetical protein